MSWAPGISTITTRVGAIESLLASRSSARADDTSAFDKAALAASTTNFDPFGTAYQQALMSAGVSPASPDAAAAPTDGVATDPTTALTPTLTSGLTPAQTSSLRTESFDPMVATRRPASASSVGGVGGVGGVGNVNVVSGDYPVVSGSGTTVGQRGGYGAMPVPAELAVYGNGHVPPDALELIGQGGHRLWGPAAESYKALVAAAHDQGIDLTVTDSYRTYDQQVQLAAEKGIYADGGWAAVPGTSNHGWGLAVDFNVNSPAALDWLRANGHSFGFVEATRREAWHWEFRPSQA